MSAAAATAGDAPKKKGSKKLLIIILAVVLLVVGGGGAAVFMMKKKAADAAAAEEGAEDSHEEAPAKGHAKTPPTFVPLDPFTVNLADKDSERFAQIGVTFEIDDPKVADEIKTYMPAIRNRVLLLLAAKSSAEMLDRQGKVRLAGEIGREAMRAMRYDVPDESEFAVSAAPAGGHDDEDEDEAPKKKKKKKKWSGPIREVHFANFIVQ